MFYMQQRLLKRKPKVMYSYFIESIFHFNGYEGHETYNKMIVSDKEKELFSLKGKEHQENRMKLYKFMMVRRRITNVTNVVNYFLQEETPRHTSIQSMKAKKITNVMNVANHFLIQET